MLVKQVVEYSILQKCDAQIVTQNASSYADEETINIITSIAVQYTASLKISNFKSRGN